MNLAPLDTQIDPIDRDEAAELLVRPFVSRIVSSMSLHQRCIYKSAIRRVAPEPQAEKAACKFNVFSRVAASMRTYFSKFHEGFHRFCSAES